MADQPAPPAPTLHETHDADAIRVLDAILTSPASEIKQRVDEAKAYFGVRIAGDLRVLEGEAAKKDLEALRAKETQSDTLQDQLKTAMTRAGIKL